jgi:phospholipase C
MENLSERNQFEVRSGTDNSIEWFDQYKVKFAPEYHAYLHKVKDVIPVKIEELKVKIVSLNGQELEKAKRELSNLQSFLEILKVDIVEYTPENFEKLSSFQKNLHKKAFTNNRADADYRELATVEYDDNGTKRSLEVPKSDVLHQFRKDVSEDKLPAVSWLVAPENFSDHPGAPWYGAWYVSEVMEILTKNPEIWKKTIFILAYDENDGYFDHVPPFVPPHHLKPNTGKVSSGIDTSVEHVNIEHEKERKYKNPEKDARESPIGLGFRVPLVIASPWSRGGQVCSEVFDHTSMLQFLEKFVSKKFNKNVKEENISDWRRTVCGDLTSVFKPYKGDEIDTLEFVKKEAFIESIHAAKFKKLPNNYKALTAEEVIQANKSPEKSAWMPKQEKGIKRACALPYELYVEGKERDDKFEISFSEQSAGCPFVVYFRENGELKTRNYAVKAGDTITDTWMLDSEKFKFEVYGPNGFYRAFKVNVETNSFDAKLWHQEGKDRKFNGNIDLQIKNISGKTIQVEVVDLAYGTGIKAITLSKNEYKKVSLDLLKSHSWYDFLIRTKGSKEAGWHYAGHVETGKESFTDPQIGGVV